ncbi:hypothetical protein LCGC14_0123610 [marine sediment metagenome]|uniref:YknX-like C-terminal permuted SH3-like domain-containing protein n=1 Tax=marine sediment metagenome TaxID=412755 RepID=A0A0F9VM55_9ZZZZ|nr:efflux RND transporter periplasmic adaptor subunit [Maribacter sp.]HDZ05806.1 efflux RND transporter periplasmic adaptor subunit [Maribacter sp.]|tara:strand:- start:10707 stop:11807 length:1101 start_codon:yes stop_codon:yes gene_type:complete
MNKIYIGFVFLSLVSCNASVEHPNGEKDRRVTEVSLQKVEVSAQRITSSFFEKQLIANGIVEAKNKSELRFKISEEIIKIAVKNGQQVKKNELLANLNNALLANLLKEKEIQFEKAKMEFTKQKINYGQGNLSNSEIDSTILSSLLIQTGYLEAQNEVKKATILYEQTILRAPFSGIVANITSKTGNFNTVGEVFCNIIDNKNMEVIFWVLESELSSIELGRDVTVSHNTNSKKKYAGNIVEINPYVNENGLVMIKAVLNEFDGKLYDGMNVQISVNESLENVIVIPKEALVLRSNKEVVFTIENGIAKWNYVSILEENSSSYAISEGLNVNDTLVVSGNLNLTHGAKLKVNFISSVNQQKAIQID